MSEVIVGVDESEAAADALRWAVREGRLRGWTVTAVLAWGWLDQHSGTLGEDFDPDYGEADAKTALEGILVAAVGKEAAAAVDRRVVNDLPARALLDAARSSELLVLGARGLGGFRGLLLGSVSQHCLQHAVSPTAVVREHTGGVAAGIAGTERIVVAVDGSQTAQQALRWALEEARLRDAAVRVVHAWLPPFVGGYRDTFTALDPELYRHAAQDVLDAAIAAEDGAGGLSVPVEPVLAQGRAAQVLLDAAEDADLLVMGTRGLGGFKGILLGSVTNQVSHHAPCPLVVLPPEPEQRA